MKKSIHKSILNKTAILLFVFSFCSCSKHFTETRQITDFSSLQSHIQKRQNLLKGRNIKIKFKTSFNYDGKENKLSGKILTYSDTSIYVNVISSTLGFEVAQIRFKTDSLIFINKIDKSYFSGVYGDIGKYLNINFQTIYSLLTNSYLCPDNISFTSDNCNFISDYQIFRVNDKYDDEKNGRFVTSQFDKYGNLQLTECKSLDGGFLRVNYSNFVIGFGFPNQLSFTTYIKKNKIESTLFIESIEIAKKADYQNSSPSLKNYKLIEL